MSGYRLNLHDNLLEREESTLSRWSVRSRDSRGRKVPEERCPVRTPFQRDRDRIIHCKAFRRLKHKTQVFLDPAGDHFRTRLTHTLETTQIARGIGRAIGLNEDLIEAIGLGHDLGHTPFGHSGEKVLNKWCLENGIEDGFQHHKQSVRVVEKIENDGKGLNLTYETLEGILKHTKGPGDYSVKLDPDENLHWEGRVVKISDRIAYVNHDLQDAIEAGLIEKSDVPSEFIDVVGETNRERISAMVIDIVGNTLDAGYLTLSDEMENAINGIKDFLFERVYYHDSIRAHDSAIYQSLEGILNKFNADKETYEKYLGRWDEDEDVRKRDLVDYVAGMTDRFAMRVANELLDPSPWVECAQ